MVRPPAIARFLMGDHAGMALEPGTPPPPLAAIMAQAEVGPTYEAVAELERQCADIGLLRHDNDRGVAERAAVMPERTTPLATNARRRLNVSAAQAQLEAALIRALCLWHCASGGL